MESYIYELTRSAVPFLTLVAAYCLVVAGLIHGYMEAEAWWKTRQKTRAGGPPNGGARYPESGREND